MRKVRGAAIKRGLYNRRPPRRDMLWRVRLWCFRTERRWRQSHLLLRSLLQFAQPPQAFERRLEGCLIGERRVLRILRDRFVTVDRLLDRLDARRVIRNVDFRAAARGIASTCRRGSTQADAKMRRVAAAPFPMDSSAGARQSREAGPVDRSAVRRAGAFGTTATTCCVGGATAAGPPAESVVSNCTSCVAEAGIVPGGW